MAAVRKSKRPAGLSDRTKKILAFSSGGIVLVLGAWWAYFTFTTIAPPDLSAPDAAAKVEQVVDFLGAERGFGRMSTARQEAYLLQAYNTYGNNPDTRSRFVRSLSQMSTAQREVFNNAIFDMGRAHVMESAREFASVAPSQRAKYIDGAYSKFEQLRSELSGKKTAGGGKGESLSEPLNKDLPKSSDEMMKVLVDKTSARERAEAKPFIDAMAAKHKEQQSQKR